MPTKKYRGIIYARPSFIEGMARIFDMGGTLNEYDFGPAPDGAESPKLADGSKADMEALRSDWRKVGDDMRSVMGGCVPITQDDSVCEDSQSADDYWESPPLTPETLKQYDAVVPGAAERIMRMVEKQAEHRIWMEKKGRRTF